MTQIHINRNQLTHLGSGFQDIGNPLPKLNVIKILIDDVGIEQFQCYDFVNQYTSNYPYAYIPNISALCASGILYTQYRVMPTCSPTRASLMSRKYPFQHGMGVFLGPITTSSGLIEFNVIPAPVFETLPQKLNVRTVAIAKWHLGSDQDIGGTMDQHPINIGFDEWRGVPRNLGDGQPIVSGFDRGYYNFWWVENGIREQVLDINVTEHSINRAIDWLENNTEPFFMYLAVNACHAPLEDSNWPRDHHGFGPTDTNGFNNTRLRACLENLDYHLGRLFNNIDWNNTVVIFSGDNGTPSIRMNVGFGEIRYPLGHPLHNGDDHLMSYNTEPYNRKGFKGTVYETGIRVPLIIYHPHYMHGTNNGLINMHDIHDIILNPNNLDIYRTESLAEAFQPNGLNIKYTEYTRSYISGQWKLIHNVLSDSFEFYDLFEPSGILELNNLTTNHPAFSGVYTNYSVLLNS